MHQIIADGKTVWVNSETTGVCIGRFSRFGIDIHRDYATQSEKGECLDCTHSLPLIEDWHRFRDGMKTYYGVLIADSAMPLFLKHPEAPHDE
jgi:hypothetical protein